MSLAIALLGALRASLKTRTDLALENLALRQQLVLLRRRSKRPQFGRLERLFWVWLSHQWAGWREALHVVRPQTVIRWHRQGFRAFWTWNSRRGRVGRPPVSSELAELVRTMALANPFWGSPRIHGELLKLGFEVSQRTVARLMPRRPKRPSQTWRTFLKNHLADLVSVDFFVVPTATFRVLYVFVVLLHHRRRVVHFNVTDSPTAAWTAQQIVEAFPDDSAPRYLLRELLDHVIVLNEGHLRRRLRSYPAPRQWSPPLLCPSRGVAAGIKTLPSHPEEVGSEPCLRGGSRHLPLRLLRRATSKRVHHRRPRSGNSSVDTTVGSSFGQRQLMRGLRGKSKRSNQL